MADYKYTGPEVTDGVRRYEDGAFIPADVRNKDWRAYLKYVTDGGLTDPWKTQEELDAIAAEEARVAEIQTARDNSGLKQVSLATAEDYIDNKLDAAGTAAEVKEAVREILKKMAAFIVQ